MTDLSDSGRLKRMVRIFQRRGGDGDWTHPFDAFPLHIRKLLLQGVSLEPGELPVLACFKDLDHRVLLTTRRLLVRQRGQEADIPWDGIDDAIVDESPKIIAYVMAKNGKPALSPMRVCLRGGGWVEIELEAGPAFYGFWNVLRAVGRVTDTVESDPMEPNPPRE